MRDVIAFLLVISLTLSACAPPGARPSSSTSSSAAASLKTTAVSIQTPLSQSDPDATAQATPFDGGVTLETEQCCISGPNGRTDRLFVRFDAYSDFGPIDAMRILLEPGKDCGGRSPASSSPIPDSVQASWEPYTHLRRDYTITVPQDRLRIVVQFRDAQGHIFPIPAGCDDAVGLGILDLTPMP